MPREKWTDERLDDLNVKMDQGFADTKAEMRAGFARVDADIRDLNARFDALNGRLVAGFFMVIVTIIGSNAL